MDDFENNDKEVNSEYLEEPIVPDKDIFDGIQENEELLNEDEKISHVGLESETFQDEESSFDENLDDDFLDEEDCPDDDLDIKYLHSRYPEKESLYNKPQNRQEKSWIKTCVGALVFGIIAGITMFGVNSGLTKINKPEEKVEESLKIKPLQGVTTYLGVSERSESDISKVVESVMPSIVSITVRQTVSLDDYYQFFGFGTSYISEDSGSGVIIGQTEKELLILTNDHVVENIDSLNVGFIDGKTVSGTVKGSSTDSDLAIISIPLEKIDSRTLKKIKIVTIGNSNNLKIGDPVIAIGNALGYGQSVTKGIVSALDKDIKAEDGTEMKNLIQTDAAINPGNSGGALLNIKGELIGINVAKLSDTEIEGIGFAIPISPSNEVIEDLLSQETRYKVDEKDRGYLQISGNSVSEEVSEVYGIPEGVYIQNLEINGSAYNAGIREGDVIVALNNKEITTMESLREELEYYKVEETVTLTIKRKETSSWKEKTIEVILGEKLN